MTFADPFSTWSHLLGAVGSAICSIWLIRRGLRRKANRFGAALSLAVFAASAVLLLSASAFYHSVPHGTILRDMTRRLDHAAIFVLIAGSFTPIHAIAFRGFMRWGILAIVWTCAAVGVGIKTAFFDQIPEWLSILTYLGMGWIGALAMILLWKRDSLRQVSPLILGGLAYSAGALCEFTGHPTLWAGVIRSHEVFHVAVLVGLGSMWMFVRRLAGTETFERREPQAEIQAETRAQTQPHTHTELKTPKNTPASSEDAEPAVAGGSLVPDA
ncbi:MAG: hemolysin III family protein [Planctomycetota bacterium]